MSLSTFLCTPCFTSKLILVTLYRSTCSRYDVLAWSSRNTDHFGAFFSCWRGSRSAQCFVLHKFCTTRESCLVDHISSTLNHETLHVWGSTSHPGCCSDTEKHNVAFSASNRWVKILLSCLADKQEERERRRRSVLCLTHGSCSFVSLPVYTIGQISVLLLFVCLGMNICWYRQLLCRLYLLLCCWVAFRVDSWVID